MGAPSHPPAVPSVWLLLPAGRVQGCRQLGGAGGGAAHCGTGCLTGPSTPPCLPHSPSRSPFQAQRQGGWADPCHTHFLRPSSPSLLPGILGHLGKQLPSYSRRKGGPEPGTPSLFLQASQTQTLSMLNEVGEEGGLPTLPWPPGGPSDRLGLRPVSPSPALLPLAALLQQAQLPHGAPSWD